ncbi:MAG: Ig-like domain-containing protein, partial [Lachnospiraceae bacterium]|nr:Ig-like domain-containing protein [Lachnospiraceae bacterium]
MMKQTKWILIWILTVMVSLSFLPTNSVNAAKVALNKKKATITVGKSVTLKLKNTKKKVTWSSSNKKIATVSSKGKVTGKKAGKATITAKAGGKKYNCKVTVKNKKNESDVKALKAIIKAQKKKGAEVSSDLDSSQYKWSNAKDSRLISIKWSNRKLKGKISFVGLSKLKAVYCDENELTGLNVMKNTKLEDLEC